MPFWAKWLLETLGPEILIQILNDPAVKAKLSPAEQAGITTALAVETVIAAKKAGAVQFVPADGSAPTIIYTYTP